MNNKQHLVGSLSRSLSQIEYNLRETKEKANQANQANNRPSYPASLIVKSHNLIWKRGKTFCSCLSRTYGNGTKFICNKLATDSYPAKL